MMARLQTEAERLAVQKEIDRLLYLGSPAIGKVKSFRRFTRYLFVTSKINLEKMELMSKLQPPGRVFPLQEAKMLGSSNLKKIS
jgi:hypothetical protein